MTMTNEIETIDAIETEKVAYAELVKTMLSHDKAATNAATPYARETFKRLLAVDETGGHAFTMDHAVDVAIAVFKPTTPSGKAGETIGSLRGTLLGQAMAGRLTAIDKVMTNIASPGVRPLVDAFVVSQGTAQAKSFGALIKAVNAAIKASAVPKAKAGDDDEAEADEDDKETPVPVSIVEKLEAFTASLAELSDADAMAIASNMPVVSALYAKLNAELLRGNALLDAATAPLAKAA